MKPIHFTKHEKIFVGREDSLPLPTKIVEYELTCPHCSDTSEYQIEDKDVTWHIGAAKWIILANCTNCGQEFKTYAYQGERLYNSLVSKFGYNKAYP